MQNLTSIGRFTEKLGTSDYGNPKVCSTVKSTGKWLLNKVSLMSLLIGGGVMAIISIVDLFHPESNNTNQGNRDNRRPHYRDRR